MVATVTKLDGREEPWVDPRKRLIAIFNSRYAKTGRENPLPYGAMMRLLTKAFEIVDEKTGEMFIEYPEIETWQEQVEGFFSDKWARDNCKYHFSYLLKQYGRFTPAKDTNIKTCPYCHNDYDLRAQSLCPKCYPKNGILMPPEFKDALTKLSERMKR